jgi:hypothetical protein
LDVDAEDLKT